MCVCQFIVAITGTASTFTNIAAQKTAIAFVCIYIFFFASTWGPVAWVVTGELFPLKVRAKCISMTTASNWLFNWAIAYATPYMTDAKYANLQSKVFFVWGSFCFVCIAFVYFFIYETKGLSLEQVDELYGIVGKAWQSKAFRPAVRFVDVNKEGIDRPRGESLADYVRRTSVLAPGANEGNDMKGVNGANGATPGTTADAKEVAVPEQKPVAEHFSEHSSNEKVGV